VYSKKFVVVLKVDGRILREFNHENLSEFESECSLLLPFGCEYSLMCKNLESRPAKMRMWIDGEDVLSGNAILVRANSSVNIDGFMNSNGKITNKFKFIQKTDQIIEHRGDKIDDGMIRVEWQFEKPKPVEVHVNYKYSDWFPAVPVIKYPTLWYNNTTYTSSGNVCPVGACASTPTASFSGEASFSSCAQPDEGITVKGSQLSKQFYTSYIGDLEENSHVVIIRLKGTDKKDHKVIVPVEVKTKIQCPTCGNVSKSGNKFCANCGTCIIEV